MEDLKRSFPKSFIDFPINSSVIPVSSLVPFSNKKHMEIDNVDDNFARGVFPFTVLTIVPTIVINVILYFIFKLLFKYKISVYFRRYYFLIPCLLQGLIEGNIQYFTYLFFRQSFVVFSFKFTDKIFIVLSVLFFFVILMVTCCFYFLFNYSLKKKFGYFIYCFYRTFPSMMFLTFRLVMKGFIRGVIHSCLH